MAKEPKDLLLDMSDFDEEEREFFGKYNEGLLETRQRILTRLHHSKIVRQGILGLHLDYVDESKGFKAYKATPSIPFKPEGFMVWGVDNHTMITSMVFANEASLFSADPVPAQFFATSRTYEELQEMANENKITLPKWCNFPALSPSTCVRIGVTGNIDNLCLWGIGHYQ